MADARVAQAEQRRHARQQPEVVAAVERVDLAAGDVGEADPGVAGGELEQLHGVPRRELGVGAHDVAVDEPRRAQRAQGDLEPVADVELEREGARPAGRLGVVEDFGERLEQPDLGVEGEPRVLVAQLGLVGREPGAAQHGVDGVAAADALGVGEHEPRGDPVGLAGLAQAGSSGRVRHVPRRIGRRGTRLTGRRS
jgi:hypothetical protein